MREIRGFMLQTYKVPDEDRFPEVPEDFEDVDVIDAEDAEIGMFVAIDNDDRVFYVADRFTTEDGFEIPLCYAKGGDMVLFSSNETFWKLGAY